MGENGDHIEKVVAFPDIPLDIIVNTSEDG